jgi:hypothetical protein
LRPRSAGTRMKSSLISWKSDSSGSTKKVWAHFHQHTFKSFRLESCMNVHTCNSGVLLLA